MGHLSPSYPPGFASPPSIEFEGMNDHEEYEAVRARNIVEKQNLLKSIFPESFKSRPAVPSKKRKVERNLSKVPLRRSGRNQKKICYAETSEHQDKQTAQQAHSAEVEQVVQPCDQGQSNDASQTVEASMPVQSQTAGESTVQQALSIEISGQEALPGRSCKEVVSHEVQATSQQSNALKSILSYDSCSSISDNDDAKEAHNNSIESFHGADHSCSNEHYESDGGFHAARRATRNYFFGNSESDDSDSFHCELDDNIYAASSSGSATRNNFHTASLSNKSDADGSVNFSFDNGCLSPTSCNAVSDNYSIDNNNESIHSASTIGLCNATINSALDEDPDNEDPDKENKSTNQPPKENKKRRNPNKKTRQFGKIVTSENALPSFSDYVLKCFKEGWIPRSHVNTAMKQHIKDITGDQYMTQDEWNKMCAVTVSEYPILGDADDTEGYSDLKYRVQNSITSERSYGLNGVPKRKKPLKVMVESQQNNSSAEMGETAASTLSDLEELQQPIRDRERLKELIAKTLTERRAKNMPVNSILIDYPHYKNGQMLLYEYTLVVEQDMETLTERAEVLLRRLQEISKDFNEEHVFSLEDNLTLIDSLQKKLLPQRFRKKEIKLCFICKDVCEVRGDAEGLHTGHFEQAPFVICVVDTNQEGERVIAKAMIAHNKKLISQIDSPTLPLILMFLLGCYFALNVAYPAAYNSFLRFLEKQINGALSEHTSQSRAKKEYFNFMKFEFNQ